MSCRLSCLVLATLMIGVIGCSSPALPVYPTSRAGSQETFTDLETPAPELATPSFKAINLTGKRSKVVRFSIPEGAIGIVAISEKGTSNFVVESLDSHGDTNALLVNEIGNYSGTLLLDAEAGVHSVAFKIESNGTWTLTVKPVTSARRWDPALPLTGKGDDVVAVAPSANGLTIVTLKHSGSSNFAILAYRSDGSDLLVNEIGKYSGETTLADGTFLLEVTADGAWSVTPQ